MRPYPVDGFHRYPASFILSMTTWLGLSSSTAFAKLDGHLAVPLALEEADSGWLVDSDLEGVRASYRFPLPTLSAKLVGLHRRREPMVPRRRWRFLASLGRAYCCWMTWLFLLDVMLVIINQCYNSTTTRSVCAIGWLRVSAS